MANQKINIIYSYILSYLKDTILILKTWIFSLKNNMNL
mgnify:CR=1 FL=1